MAKNLTCGPAATKAALDGMLARLGGGTFRLRASTSTLANVGFNATAFGGATSAVPAVATANTLVPSGVPTPGDIDNAQWITSSAVVDISFNVSTAGNTPDMVISNVTIPGTATSVTVSGLTFSLEIGPTP
jgi:hypothetical protein